MQKQQAVSRQAAIARQLQRISPELKQIVQDQLQLAEKLSAHRLFKIAQEQHQIQIGHQLFYVQFFTPDCPPADASHGLAHCHFSYAGQKAELLEEFFLQEVHFLTGDLKAQHPLFLRSKAQRLRELLLEQLYLWADGAERVNKALQGMDLAQAELIDQLMMQAEGCRGAVMQDWVQRRQPLPAEALQAFQQMFRLDAALGQEALPLQALMESYDDFCFSAAQFLDPAIYRIMSLSFREHFSLNDLIEHEDDIRLLYPHAREQPHMLGFVRLMNREVWRRADALSKQHFLAADPRIWQKKAAVLPLFDGTRPVNWLFRQPAEVLDWVSQNIQHGSVRTAVAALSFIDSSQMHPQVILAALQYFQHAAARLFIQSCHDIAVQESWFEHPQNTAAVLQGTRQAVDDTRAAIRPSILYLDEWIALAGCIAKADDAALKKVHLRLSRVMQAFMLHLQKITAALPADLMAFILPERQQERGFYTALQRRRMPPDKFRQQFYLQAGAVRKTVFDAYVRDYLSAYFAAHKTVPKSVTWMGLFHQAAAWHDQIQKEEILSKLKKDFSLAAWRPVCAQPQLEFEQWRFEELQSIERIIEESKRFRHCLAASYAQRIIEGEYAAFHMAHAQAPHRMTLGCRRENGQLLFDQLELPDNAKADELSMQAARRFVDWLNQNQSSEN